MAGTHPYHLFEVAGIELEYMIVDRTTLDVRPVSDRLMYAACGAFEAEIERGPVAWSNELARHVFEIKTNGPVRSLAGVAADVQRSVGDANALLAAEGCALMPSAMHPWMHPETEFDFWPHEYADVYRAFDRVFGCRTHGWANLQSMHVNLPFADDEEFGRLHAAIRLILPLVPALAASSPVLDGALTGLLDSRLEVYRHNAVRVPAVAGRVIPEPVYTQAAYEGELLASVYEALAAHDPEGVLRHEWVNARGAIARFDRGSIEIRVIDMQECPEADLAVAAAIIAAVRALTAGPDLRAWSIDRLVALLDATIRDADETLIADAEYLAALGYRGAAPARARDVWRHLIDTTLTREDGAEEFLPALDRIHREGCLARRIRARLGPGPTRDELRAVYAELCACLAAGRQLTAG